MICHQRGKLRTCLGGPHSDCQTALVVLENKGGAYRRSAQSPSPCPDSPVSLSRGQFCPRVDIWQPLVTFLVVTAQGGDRYQHLVIDSRDVANTV